MAVPVYVPPHAGQHPELSRLTAALSLPTLRPGDRGLLLEYASGHLQIRPVTGRQRPWFVDFASARSAYRRAHGGGVRQALARAIGVKPGKRPHVVDATAGWGRDAFVLAGLGCTIDMIERHPLVAALLADGLRRAAGSPEVDEIVQRMRLHRADARDYLLELRGDTVPEVIYLDPMYPLTDKTAGVKKDLRLLRDLLDEPGQDPALLEAALAVARDRVVVKRPKAARPLTGRPPDAVIASTNTRYDMYLKPQSTKLGAR